LSQLNSVCKEYKQVKGGTFFETQCIYSRQTTVKAKFHYAIWSQTGPRLVADLLAGASSLLAS